MLTCPLVFQPILKPKIWGGRRLETQLGKELTPGELVGESWEVADLEDDQSVVSSGPAQGRTLGDLVREWGVDLLGQAKLFGGRFPLLIKYLDARENLSVQVHPDESMARRLGGSVRVKDEAWFVVAVSGDGCIYRGFKPGVTREGFTAAIEAGTVASTLNRIAVKAGQCYMLPSGTVHALGAGVLIAEVQTPSDTTYRVHDWDRVDPGTGQGRTLHVAEALECASFHPVDPATEQRSHVGDVWTTVTRLITCDSFTIERVRMTEGLERPLSPGRLAVWMVLQGEGRIAGPAGAEPCRFALGDTLLLPAGLEDSQLITDTDCTFLEVTIPQG
ncbi:MAG: mannose-6-phosphate isomerase [bacterium]|nr:mannose-6-phosphate isomerase [bacterium]